MRKNILYLLNRQKDVAFGTANWGAVVDGVQTRDIVSPNGNGIVGKLTLELKVHNEKR